MTPSPPLVGALTPRAERLIRTASITAAIVIALSAMVLSYAGLHDLAIDAHVPPRLALLVPVMVDGLQFVGSLGVVYSTLSGLRTWYPWTLLMMGVSISAWGNWQAAPNDLTAKLLHAAAPIILALVLEELLRVMRHKVTLHTQTLSDEAATDTGSEPAPASEVVPSPSPAPTPTPEPEATTPTDTASSSVGHPPVDTVSHAATPDRATAWAVAGSVADETPASSFAVDASVTAEAPKSQAPESDDALDAPLNSGRLDSNATEVALAASPATPNSAPPAAPPATPAPAPAPAVKPASATGTTAKKAAQKRTTTTKATAAKAAATAKKATAPSAAASAPQAPSPTQGEQAGQRPKQNLSSGQRVWVLLSQDPTLSLEELGRRANASPMITRQVHDNWMKQNGPVAATTATAPTTSVSTGPAAPLAPNPDLGSDGERALSDIDPFQTA